jgi:hypothetical protein
MEAAASTTHSAQAFRISLITFFDGIQRGKGMDGRHDRRGSQLSQYPGLLLVVTVFYSAFNGALHLISNSRVYSTASHCFLIFALRLGLCDDLSVWLLEDHFLV